MSSDEHSPTASIISEKRDLSETKAKFYERLLSNAKGLLSGESDTIANLANISSLLFNEMNVYQPKWINWAGFYIMKKGGLVLGPFHGKPACIRIQVGKGVCGTAVLQQKTQVRNTNISLLHDPVC